MKQVFTAVAISASLICAASPALAQKKHSEPATISPNDDSHEPTEDRQAKRNDRARDAALRKRAAAPLRKMPKKPRSYR